MKHEIESGPHLGAVRSWIQIYARNGERVTWGSQEHLEMAVTVSEMEWLAQRIKDALSKEMESENDLLRECIFEIAKAKSKSEIKRILCKAGVEPKTEG
jgi:hypothetical protein